ncbi:MAG TPA: hypothetical protein VFW65_17140 [Pseudonocardiaceae bacterium]|nr:hypothetical protein [Pseudonocardiaceae bacterium]
MFRLDPVRRGPFLGGDATGGAGITDYQLWWFDVAEWFTSAADLGRRLAGTPSDADDALRRIVARHSDGHGVPMRHQRLVARFRTPV